MTVVPLCRPVVKLDHPMPATRVLSTEARQAFSSLEGNVGMLRRCFSANFCTESQAAEIEKLCEAVQSDAKRLWRITR